MRSFIVTFNIDSEELESVQRELIDILQYEFGDEFADVKPFAEQPTQIVPQFSPSITPPL